MPRVGFQLTVGMLERSKAVHALYCSATVIGDELYMWSIFVLLCYYICKIVIELLFLPKD
jgi:hypothetical protein